MNSLAAFLVMREAGEWRPWEVEEWRLIVFWRSGEKARASFSSLHFVLEVLAVVTVVVSDSVVVAVGGLTHAEGLGKTRWVQWQQIQ